MELGNGEEVHPSFYIVAVNALDVVRADELVDETVGDPGCGAAVGGAFGEVVLVELSVDEEFVSFHHIFAGFGRSVVELVKFLAVDDTNIFLM